MALRDGCGIHQVKVPAKNQQQSLHLWDVIERRHATIVSPLGKTVRRSTILSMTTDRSPRVTARRRVSLINPLFLEQAPTDALRFTHSRYFTLIPAHLSKRSGTGFSSPFSQRTTRSSKSPSLNPLTGVPTHLGNEDKPTELTLLSTTSPNTARKQKQTKKSKIQKINKNLHCR